MCGHCIIRKIHFIVANRDIHPNKKIFMRKVNNNLTHIENISTGNMPINKLPKSFLNQ